MFDFADNSFTAEIVDYTHFVITINTTERHHSTAVCGGIFTTHDRIKYTTNVILSLLKHGHISTMKVTIIDIHIAQIT